jgi:hypothetical protein
MGASVKPRLYIVREATVKNDDDFNKQYKAVTDHLIKVIRKDGRLDLKEYSPSSQEFSSTAAGLREETDFKDRPFAFLFIKPSPHDQATLQKAIYDLADVADASMVDNMTGAKDPALASSVLFFNQQELTKNNPSTYQDDLTLFKTIDFDEGNSIDVISNNLSKIRNLFVRKANLEKEINTYAKGLIDHVLEMHKAKIPGETSTGNQVILGDEDTVGKLNANQQKQVYSIDWEEQIRKARKDIRFKIMNRIIEEATVQDIAAQFEISTSQINHILNAFLSDPDGFIANKPK